MKRLAALCGALLLAPPTLAVDGAEPLTIAAAIRSALAVNEIPAIAAARVEHAAALRRQAVAALVPRLTFSTTYTRRAQEVTREIDGDEVTVQAIDALNGQALAQATLVDLRALPLLRAATRGVAAQRLESSELERALAHDTATGFLLVLGAEQLRDAARERVRVAAKTVDEARLRVEAGLAGRNDATRAELELATARLGFVPRLDARGLYTGTNEAGLSGREEDWNVAVTLIWELFDGGNRSALAAQLDAEAEEAELALAQSRRAVTLEVGLSATELTTSEASLVQAEARLAAARDNALEVRERYGNGLATALEQADAAVEQFEAESELVRQRYTRALSRLALARAIGLWPDGASEPPEPAADDSPPLPAEIPSR